MTYMNDTNQAIDIHEQYPLPSDNNNTNTNSNNPEGHQ